MPQREHPHRLYPLISVSHQPYTRHQEYQLRNVAFVISLNLLLGPFVPQLKTAKKLKLEYMSVEYIVYI